MMARVALSLLGLAAVACGNRPDADASAGPDAPARGDATAAADDSLAATMAGGYELWLTLARADSGAGGRCLDRAVEIRHDGRRTPVPLLYTSAPLEPVNDSTFRARLSTHCTPGDRYLVNVRTGRPVRER
jgi:hypothetical protein